VTGLQPIRGHVAVRAALASALHSGRLSSALLLTGPAGIGKQRLGLWLGQFLLCAAPSATGPCDSCRACRLVLHLEHPDVHWFFPLARPKVSGGPDRLGDALEDARAHELEIRRSDPYYVTMPNELTGIYLAHAQVIRRIAAARPAMAAHKVFIIGNADLLVPQEASPEAANSLLKLLEEPPADTTIVATTAEPEGLLPTVRSRLQPIRVPPLSDTEVVSFLEEVRGLAPEQARIAGRLAGGSIGRALGFVTADGDAGPLEEIRLRAKEILGAALAGLSERTHEIALRQAPAGARGDFSTLLESLMTWLRDLAAVGAGTPETVVNLDAIDWLQAVAARLDQPSRLVPRALDRVNDTLHLTQFNINPQLALSTLVRGLADIFSVANGATPVGPTVTTRFR
jgi:DNA polymerase III subunit delta'